MGKLNKHISLFLLAFSLALSASSQTYCIPYWPGTGPADIQQVSVGSIYHITTTGGSVTNYTHLKTSIGAGDTVLMGIVAGHFNFYAGVSVFVDLNNDFDLVDPNELVYNYYTGSTVHSVQLTVPVNTIPGLHRMRVISELNTTIANADPCGIIIDGDFHDYTLEVTNNCPKDSNMRVLNFTDSTADFSWAARSGIGYEYVLKTDTVDPIGLGTATSTNSHSANGLSSQQRYYFHLRTSCGNGMYSPWERISFVTCNLPDAPINQSGDFELCEGYILQLSVPLDSNFTYQWYNNGTKLLGNTSNTFNVQWFSGKYYVKVRRSQACVTLSDTANVEVLNVPDPPSITVNGDTLTTNGFSYYLWHLSGIVVQADSSNTYTVSQNGKYWVTGIDSNGCRASSDTVNLIGVGISTYSRATRIKLFPNPTSGIYSLSLDQVYKQTTITIKDISGRTLSSIEYRNIDKMESKLDGDPGVYFLEINTDQGFLGTLRVLKE